MDTALYLLYLATYRGVGHAVHWEEPARFAADLVEFAESLGQEISTEWKRALLRFCRLDKGNPR